MDPLKRIEICMGSSCFSRGNNRNIEVIQQFLASHPALANVDLSGHLCQGFCKEGPNVTFNGRMYHQLDPAAIERLLNHYSTLPGA